jgi:hypothetical protein
MAPNFEEFLSEAGYDCDFVCACSFTCLCLCMCVNWVMFS